MSLRLCLHLLRVAPIVGAGLLALGCQEVEEEGESQGASAFTVAGGDVFVVSAAPEHIVLRKKVGRAMFPFKGADLVGKAMMLYPIEGKADAGIFSRVIEVHDAGARLEVQAEPLTYAQMLRLEEDDIVRIFVDPALTSRAPTRRPTAQRPAVKFSPTTELSPPGERTGFSGVLTGDDPKIWAWATGPMANVRGTVDISGEAPRMTIESDISWDPKRGFDMELRAEAHFDSTLAFDVSAGPRVVLAKTPPATLLDRWTLPFGIPLRIHVFAESTCYAVGHVRAQGTARFTWDASAQTSLRVHPAEGRSFADWFEPGRVPTRVQTEATLNSDLDFSPNVGILCFVARVNAELGVLGGGGPYVSWVPQVWIGDKPAAAVSLRAGVFGKLFGNKAGLEMDLVRWSQAEPGAFRR